MHTIAAGPTRRPRSSLLEASLPCLGWAVGYRRGPWEGLAEQQPQMQTVHSPSCKFDSCDSYNSCMCWAGCTHTLWSHFEIQVFILNNLTWTALMLSFEQCMHACTRPHHASSTPAAPIFHLHHGQASSVPESFELQYQCMLQVSSMYQASHAEHQRS